MGNIRRFNNDSTVAFEDISFKKWKNSFIFRMELVLKSLMIGFCF
jgi:hypothetical protein